MKTFSMSYHIVVFFSFLYPRFPWRAHRLGLVSTTWRYDRSPAELGVTASGSGGTLTHASLLQDGRREKEEKGPLLVSVLSSSVPADAGVWGLG